MHHRLLFRRKPVLSFVFRPRFPVTLSRAPWMILLS